MQEKFKFFEAVCEELASKDSVVLTRNDFGPPETDTTLINELIKEMGVSTSQQAILEAVKKLSEHFQAKSGVLPFEYDEASGRFTVVDPGYVKFIAKMSANRGVGRESREFELNCTDWISRRLEGEVHRVGWPRKKCKKKAQFLKHLIKLGFQKSVVYGNEKDAGFDIIWLPPLGSIPHRLVVSIQCKNAAYNVGDADKSVGSVGRSLYEHKGLGKDVHVPCVLFNDYITDKVLPKKRMNFLPLGLSDFVHNTQPVTMVKL